MSKHLGIQVKFVDYLSDDVHGKLLPREKRILINAHKPRTEHIYTVLHEIGHFLIHFKSLPRRRHPRIFDINWKAEWLARLCSTVRRYYRFIFNKESGKEWDADVWAMCAFIYLAKHIGCRNDLFTFLDHHPEKTGTFFLCALVTIYCDAKTRIKKVGHALAMPLQTLSKSYFVVTKPGSLHSASIWPTFRLCARSVALNLHPTPKPDFQPTEKAP